MVKKYIEMRKNMFLFLLVIIGKLSLLDAQPKRDWDIVPPMNIPAVITGSFGELRSNSFHTGIDFATNQTIGQPVYSVDDGFISRVFVSSGGYGKALYIDHPNGYTTVYAHLDQFSANMEKFVNDLQYRKESFYVDHYFKAGEMPVKKGDLIAKSGNSGSSSGPHLHFEIRETAAQRPVNAHFFNLPIKDEIPPNIQAICIYPMDNASEVNGKNEPLYVQVVASNGQFKLNETPNLTASGNIGVGIEVIDYYNDGRGKCGIYSILLKADNQKVFESKLDGILFDNRRYINSHVDFARQKTTGKWVQRSFVEPNNRLNVYSTNSNRGIIEMLPDNTHIFQYEVTDPAGNVSTLSFNIRGVEKQPEIVSLSPMKLSASQAYSTEIEGFKVDFPANSFYTEVPSYFSVEPNKGLGIGRHFRILNETIPIHKNFEISIPIPDEVKNKKGLCGARVAKGKLVYVSGTKSNGKMVISARDAGTYTLAIDTISPTIKLLNPPQDKNYSNSKEIRFEIKDNFSGIKNYRCTFDGKWQLFEYDAKKNVLIGTFTKMRIEKGKKHALSIKVTDNVGNEKVYNLTIQY